jgi:hypothetical protein
MLWCEGSYSDTHFVQFIPTLNWTQLASSGSCGPECQDKEKEARLLLHERMAPELAQASCQHDGTCTSYGGLSLDVPVTQPIRAMQAAAQPGGQEPSQRPHSQVGAGFKKALDYPRMLGFACDLFT